MISELHKLHLQDNIKEICELILSCKTIAQWNKTVDEFRIIYGYNIENYWRENLSFDENEQISRAIDELKTPSATNKKF